MERDDYPAKAMHIADIAMKKFNEWKDKYECVGDVRGLGAMMGIEFVKDKAIQRLLTLNWLALSFRTL